MIVWQDLALMRPLWLLAAIPAMLIALYAARRAGGLSAWRRAVAPEMLAALTALGGVSPASARRGWAAALLALTLALALAGPATRDDRSALFGNVSGLVIAVDMSGSLAKGPGRSQALLAARIAAEAAAGRPTALVLFAGDAYVAMGLTEDAKTLIETIAYVDEVTIPDIGSRPGRAVTLAREILARAEIAAGDILVIGDGGGVDAAALNAAEAAAVAGYPVAVVGVGGVAAPVAALAAAGGGPAIAANDPAGIAAAFAGGPAARLAESPYAELIWRDQGRWLLAFALFPALALFRARG